LLDHYQGGLQWYVCGLDPPTAERNFCREQWDLSSDESDSWDEEV